MWLRVLLARLNGRKVERHTLRFEIKPPPGGSEADKAELARDLEAEVARQLAAGNGSAVTQAALEDIARQHGATLEDFKDD